MEALQLKITGEKKLTSLLQEYTWENVAKLEQDFLMDNTVVEGRTFQLADFTSIDFLVIVSDQPFNLTIVKEVGLDIDILANKVFLLTPEEALTSIQMISTTTGQSFSLRVYEGA